MSKKIGLIVGSLQKNSWNRKVAEVVQKLFPDGYEAEFIEIKDLPLFNEDFEKDLEEPESYAPFREEVKEKDGIIFFTPEYNRTFTPAIKNAVDVGSRPYGKNVWDGKPAAVVSASPGTGGGMAANLGLRQGLVCLNLILLQKPEVYLAQIHNSFAGGELSDRTKALLEQFVEAYIEHLNRF
ncbi:chromate reductase [Peptoniphilus ivorii]|uniref:NADPH-dependent FMN reductase n=1 Tax=Aedoeadaptatus ivorii TaxID=54006 RepID=UPI002787B706|nr:NAD(P)H-dependent oxidoreductase [Peptoniphilus ivorii]MDQ0508817.1 chromate reductase [Peptoniphilus ivorii]